jgi:hypothetical protein
LPALCFKSLLSVRLTLTKGPVTRERHYIHR